MIIKRKKKYIRVGIFLLLGSFIVGYGGLSVAVLLYILTDNKSWVWTGAGIYGFSWLLFGLGFIISGREGLIIIKDILTRRY